MNVTAKNAIFFEESLKEETTDLILVVDAKRKQMERRRPSLGRDVAMQHNA